ncbi:ribbon-helix-helix domain-containing protein [Caldimonas mangrovi]|uniref:ribbon-helix-helix domain-containing protein n=1 Tax=Caldimonas mangrovi TaxID=2944811 RepID=UPI0034A54568
MATSSHPKAARAGRGERAAGYIQPGRVGKKPLVGYFSKDAHKAIKQLALDLDRKVEDLMGEAFHDLLIKVHRYREAKLFRD